MPSRTASATVERLATQLFDGRPAGPFGLELLGWLGGSPRFRSFAETNGAKIRKKLRSPTDPEARLDVRAELLVAYLLLADRRIDLEFEAYGSGKRGPDFTVTFREQRSFNLEVTRLRREPDPAALTAVLVQKLHQLPPSLPNALLVAVPADTVSATGGAAGGGAASGASVGGASAGGAASGASAGGAASGANAGGAASGASAAGSPIAGAGALADATRALRARADRKDEEFFVARGLQGTKAFYQRYLRLSAVFVAVEGRNGSREASLWLNPSARIPIPAQAANAALRCLKL